MLRIFFTSLFFVGFCSTAYCDQRIDFLTGVIPKIKQLSDLQSLSPQIRIQAEAHLGEFEKKPTAYGSQFASDLASLIVLDQIRLMSFQKDELKIKKNWQRFIQAHEAMMKVPSKPDEKGRSATEQPVVFWNGALNLMFDRIEKTQTPRAWRDFIVSFFQYIPPYVGQRIPVFMWLQLCSVYESFGQNQLAIRCLESAYRYDSVRPAPTVANSILRKIFRVYYWDNNASGMEKYAEGKDPQAYARFWKNKNFILSVVDSMNRNPAEAIKKIDVLLPILEQKMLIENPDSKLTRGFRNYARIFQTSQLIEVNNLEVAQRNIAALAENKSVKRDPFLSLSFATLRSQFHAKKKQYRESYIELIKFPVLLDNESYASHLRFHAYLCSLTHKLLMPLGACQAKFKQFQMDFSGLNDLSFNTQASLDILEINTIAPGTPRYQVLAKKLKGLSATKQLTSVLRYALDISLL